MRVLTQGSGSQGQGQQAEASHLRRERPRRGTKLTIVLTCTLLTDANTSISHRYVLVIFYLGGDLLQLAGLQVPVEGDGGGEGGVHRALVEVGVDPGCRRGEAGPGPGGDDEEGVAVAGRVSGRDANVPDSIEVGGHVELVEVGALPEGADLGHVVVHVAAGLAEGDVEAAEGLLSTQEVESVVVRTQEEGRRGHGQGGAGEPGGGRDGWLAD